jgi:hypothetical protein
MLALEEDETEPTYLFCISWIQKYQKRLFGILSNIINLYLSLCSET